MVKRGIENATDAAQSALEATSDSTQAAVEATSETFNIGANNETEKQNQ
ncbi:hypothetical protein [Brevibacillus daliensis]|nr:hypothetical protein [Brevibacillus daliensis]